MENLYLKNKSQQGYWDFIQSHTWLQDLLTNLRHLYEAKVNLLSTKLIPQLLYSSANKT